MGEFLSRLIHYIAQSWPAIVALCILAFWSGLAGYWTAEREPPLRVDDIQVLTPTVHAGEKLRVQSTVSRSGPCELTVGRVIIDSDRVLFRIESDFYPAGRSEVGSAETFIQKTPVPRAAQIGPARLRETLVHVCNPIHRIWPVTQRLPDMLFYIEAVPVLD